MKHLKNQMLKKIEKIGRFKLWEAQRDYLWKKHSLDYLFWECTLTCNFSCRHCGSRAEKHAYQGELTTEEIKKVLREVAEDFDAKKITIAVTGGEPLLRKDVFEVMKYAKELGFSWGMVTNGFLIDENIIEKMKEAGMESIDISIDGIGEAHDSFRGVVGAYERAVKGVKLLAAANFLKILRVSTTFSQKSFSQLEQMSKLVFSWGANAWRIMDMDPIGRAQDNKELLLDKSQEKELLDFIKRERNLFGKKITWPCVHFLGYDYEGEVRNYLFFCRTGVNIASILHNGDIFACPNIERRPELIQGNVRRDRFSQIWNNKFEIFRDKNRTWCSDCASCEHWSECRGGSFHLWDFDKGSPKKCFLK